MPASFKSCMPSTSTMSVATDQPVRLASGTGPPSATYAEPATRTIKRHEARVVERGVQHVARRHAFPEPVPRINERREPVDQSGLYGAEHEDAGDLRDPIERVIAEVRVLIADADREEAVRRRRTRRSRARWRCLRQRIAACERNADGDPRGREQRADVEDLVARPA